MKEGQPMKGVSEAYSNIINGGGSFLSEVMKANGRERKRITQGLIAKELVATQAINPLTDQAETLIRKNERRSTATS